MIWVWRMQLIKLIASRCKGCQEGGSYPQLVGHCVHDVSLPLEVKLQAHLQARKAELAGISICWSC